MKLTIGIDPGASGGIAFIPDNNPAKAWAVKMPETLADLWHELDSLEWAHNLNNMHCCLEKVHSMPGQGVASSFKFGQGFGHLEWLSPPPRFHSPTSLRRSGRRSLGA